MTSLLKCSALIRVAVVIVMMVFMVSQANIFANGKSDDDGNSHDDNKVKQVEVTNWQDNPCCVDSQIEQHHADMTADHLVLESKIDSLSSSSTPSMPQPVQGEYSADLLYGTYIVEVGRFTVPLNQRLVIELISLQVQGEETQKAWQVFVTTSIGGVTAEHPIGTIVHTGHGAARWTPNITLNSHYIIGSFHRTLYADLNTEVIFTVRGYNKSPTNPAPVKVTFSGRLIDVP